MTDDQFSHIAYLLLRVESALNASTCVCTGRAQALAQKLEAATSPAEQDAILARVKADRDADELDSFTAAEMAYEAAKRAEKARASNAHREAAERAQLANAVHQASAPYLRE